MSRPFCRRFVAGKPVASVFKPAGIPSKSLEFIAMTLDEFEAIRLADLNGLYQEQAATQMNVSRPTFGRILEKAHQKVAEALISGKALQIEGGVVYLTGRHRFCCEFCKHEWKDEPEMNERKGCPVCRRRQIYQGMGEDKADPSLVEHDYRHRSGWKGRPKQENPLVSTSNKSERSI